MNGHATNLTHNCFEVQSMNLEMSVFLKLNNILSKMLQRYRS